MELVPTRAMRRMNITTGAMSWRLRKAKDINKEALDPQNGVPIEAQRSGFDGEKEAQRNERGLP